MDLMDIILHRRSIRKYKNESISDEKLEKILQAGLFAPTSMNRKPCEFFVVKDKDTLKKLSKAKKHGGAMLAKCDTAIVVAGNSEKADTWIEDSSIALGYMHLMADSLGVGSCWCQIHLRSSFMGIDAEEIVREILELSEEYRIVGILSLGMPDEEAELYKLEDTDFTKVHGWEK